MKALEVHLDGSEGTNGSGASFVAMFIVMGIVIRWISSSFVVSLLLVPFGGNFVKFSLLST